MLEPNSSGPRRQTWRCIRANLTSVCVALAFLPLSLLCAQAADSNKKSQWILVQNGIERSDHVVTVSYDGVKIFSPKYGYYVMTAAPSWDVHCFRPAEKIEWVTKFETFNGNRLFSPFATGNANNTPMTFYGKADFKGLKITKYSHVDSPKSLSYGADEIPVSAKTAEFLCRYYDVPTISKIPLFHCNDKGYASVKREGGHWSFDEIAADVRQGTVVDLTTNSWRKVPYKASDFQYPRGFKRVTSAGQAAYSRGQKEMFNDFLDGVGLSTEQKGTKGSKDPGKK